MDIFDIVKIKLTKDMKKKNMIFNNKFRCEINRYSRVKIITQIKWLYTKLNNERDN